LWDTEVYRDLSDRAIGSIEQGDRVFPEGEIVFLSRTCDTHGVFSRGVSTEVRES